MLLLRSDLHGLEHQADLAPLAQRARRRRAHVEQPQQVWVRRCGAHVPQHGELTQQRLEVDVKVEGAQPLDRHAHGRAAVAARVLRVQDQAVGAVAEHAVGQVFGGQPHAPVPAHRMHLAGGERGQSVPR